jgi:hypothetical protein
MPEAAPLMRVTLPWSAPEGFEIAIENVRTEKKVV